MTGRLAGKRILVTQADAFMGPALCAALAAEGAEVMALSGALADAAAVDAMLAGVPPLDAQFAAYLCSDAANCFVGQVFPVCGGWAVR